ncbi:MAG TPA: glycerophosphodiester phosphodiesterase [Nitrolancea sp.]|nr:glycerophosphodiester phosphodiesterase [Nitrolancea sp.]
MFDRKRPLIVAHRGGSPGEVENSAAAFEHALRLDVDMLEFDVRQAGDGQLVLWHNPVLHAAGRRWVVQDTSLEQLRELVPTLLTLDEYLEQFGRRLPFNLDLKTHGFEAAVVASLERHAMIDQALISSGHTLSLRRLARLNGALQRGLSRGHAQSSSARVNLLAPVNSRYQKQAILPMLKLANANAAMLQYRLADADIVARLHRAGYCVFAWTIDNGAEAAALAATGVDGMTSNVPQRIRWALDQVPASNCDNTEGSHTTRVTGPQKR